MSLSDEKQLDFFAKSIEESSKHVRNLLLILIVSSLYVLVAAYSAGVADKLKLPVLDMEVKISEFYAISPIIILTCYVHLHIYVADLKWRLAIFDSLRWDTTPLPSPRLMLFPWLLTFDRSKPEVAASIDRAAGPPFVTNIYCFCSLGMASRTSGTFYFMGAVRWARRSVVHLALFMLDFHIILPVAFVRI